MREEQWRTAWALFQQSADLPREQIDAFLHRSDVSPEIRKMVDRMLVVGESPGMSTGPADSVSPSKPAAALFASGAEIDRYLLTEKIGEGGMGEVWLAEQKEPVRRRVALKLIKGGASSREVIARFESERQALALMDHPGIAKVFDAGSTPQGAPYFVMEYAEGEPVTAYCERRHFSIRRRLELFIDVCEAVEHAHRKGVIHRDLKPSNILVTEVDGRPSPKIIDFGVAKALTQKLSSETIETRFGSLVGTLEYMSPEQAASSGIDIDTRTDVYSLGIVFYELLVGARPIDLRSMGLEEFLRWLREEDTPKPSTQVGAKDGALARDLRGDLDAIALKALEKKRARRYRSAAGFAEDIGRYLRNEPVLAVAPSQGYRARKFARRHRGALIASVAIALVLTAATIVSTSLAIRATQAEQETVAVNNFLQHDLLAQASPYSQGKLSAKPDRDLKVRTALDRAASRIAGKFDRQPGVEAAIRDTIGQAYLDLGLYPEAQVQAKRELELQRRTLGPDHPRTLQALQTVARIAWRQGKYPEAEALLNELLPRQRRVLGPDHHDTLGSMNDLVLVYIGLAKYAQAEELSRQTLSIQRRVLGPEHPDTLASMGNEALADVRQGKYAEAEALDREALAIERRALGPEYPDALILMTNLAYVYNSQGKYGEAEALDRETWRTERRVLGPDHPDTLVTMINLGGDYNSQGKYAEAEALYHETLASYRRVLGPEHPDALTTMNNLARAYFWQGKFAQAEALDRQTLEIRRRVLAPEHRNTLMSMANLALDYNAQGKHADSEALSQQTLEIRRRVLGAQHPDTLFSMYYVALVYSSEGKPARVESYASQALAGRRQRLGSEHPETMKAAALLAQAYLLQGKFGESESLSREVLETDRKKRPDDWQTFRAESLFGASLAGEKKYPEAEPLLLAGYQGMSARKSRMAIPDWREIDQARERLVQLYQAWGRPEKAAVWRKVK